MSKSERDGWSGGDVGAFFDGDAVDVEALEDELIGEMFDEVADAFEECNDAQLDAILNGATAVRPALFGRFRGGSDDYVMPEAPDRPARRSGWVRFPFLRRFSS